MDTTTLSTKRHLLDLFPALGLMAVIVASEYLSRHFVSLWLPVLGRPVVNDMLVSGTGYIMLVWLTIPSEKRNVAALREAVTEIWSFIRNQQVQVAIALALGAGWLAYVDRFLWGHFEFPSLTSPWQADATLFEPVGVVLSVVSLLLFNGLVVPFAEEWLWRGLLQPRMTSSLGSLTGLLVTSVLFSLKHVVVDASLGRLMTLTAFGIVMGVTASRRGWRAAALAHALANTVATILVLVLDAGQL